MSTTTSPSMLDVFCPMHIKIDQTGRICDVGPTLRKLRDEDDWADQQFLDVFAVKRPSGISGIDDLRDVAGTKLRLAMRDVFGTELKGVLMSTGNDGHMVLNLSFGISILNAVRDYALTAADFAATDLTIEMLYLIEANSMAMTASRSLSQRLQGARVAAEEQAFTDTLTGLKNRRAADFELNNLIERGSPFALMQIDLDHFKAVNDTMGHAAGDHVLHVVARIMTNELRTCDTVARVGGDEFIILVDGIQSRAALTKMGARIIDKLQEPIPFQGQFCRISASIGTAMSHIYEAITADQLLRDADTALYASKDAGRACQTFFKPDLRKQA